LETPRKSYNETVQSANTLNTHFSSTTRFLQKNLLIPLHISENLRTLFPTTHRALTTAGKEQTLTFIQLNCLLSISFLFFAPKWWNSYQVAHQTFSRM